MLTALVSQGVSLWCIKKAVLPLTAGQLQYPLPPGAADVLGMQYRTQTALTGGSTISGAGWQGLAYAAAVLPTNVQLALSAPGLPQLVVEASTDGGTTWVQVAAFDVPQSALPAGTLLAQDIENPISAARYRVRDVSGALVAMSSLVFSNAPSEIPMTAFNRDDYFSIPNKTYTSNRALQYWFDKQINPVVNLWPVPNTPDQVVLRYHRQIQDVGSFTNLIECPQRWLEYITFELACRVALEMPPSELPPNRLEFLTGKASEELEKASDGETDGAPFKIQPNLRGYT